MDLVRLATEKYCYLTTTGRVTRQPRTIEIWFAIEGRTLYILSGGGEAADWVKNALRNPRVTIKVGEQTFVAHARRAAEGNEQALARRLVSTKYAAEEEGLVEWAETALPMAFDISP